MSEIKTTSLRFNLDKPQQEQAWRYLQTMDRQKFKSYSQTVAVAVVDYFERYYRSQDDPYFETRIREEQFVQQIVTAVEQSLRKTLPLFLAGCMAGMGQVGGQSPSVSVNQTAENKSRLDWNFIGDE